MTENKATHRRKFHFIYKTTCLITKKHYFGMHSTDVIEDGYLGSGKILRYSIRKYGKENHIREIYEMLPDRESLRKKEAEIIDKNRLKDPECMNLVVGGGYAESVFQKISQGQKKKIYCIEEKIKKSKIAIEREKKKRESGYRISNETKLKISLARFGKKKSDETKLKMSIAAKLREKKKKDSGYKVSIETRKKLSKIHLGHHRKMSEATKQKLSEINMGKKHSEETKRKISEISKLHRHTDEVKLRMSLNSKNKKKSEEHKQKMREGWAKRKLRHAGCLGFGEHA